MSASDKATAPGHCRLTACISKFEAAQQAMLSLAGCCLLALEHGVKSRYWCSGARALSATGHSSQVDCAGGQTMGGRLPKLT